VEASERVCAETANFLAERDAGAAEFTGVIGWGLPVDAMIGALPPSGGRARRWRSILPAAEGIVTTDLYTEDSARDVGGGSVVGTPRAPA